MRPSAGIGVVEVQKLRCFLRFCRCACDPLPGSAWSRCKNSRFLEHPSLPKFLPLAQTYCKTRGRHQNMINVHFFLLREFFPKLGWSVLQDDLSLNFRKERAEIEVQNERKYPQNERTYPQTSANLKLMPAFLWMEERDLVELFLGGERFWGVEQKSVIRAFVSRT